MVWVIYYIYRYFDFRCRAKNKGSDFYTKKNSMYYEEFEVEGEEEEEEVQAEKKNDAESIDSFDKEMAE